EREPHDENAGRTRGLALALEAYEQLRVLASREARVIRRPLRHPADPRMRHDRAFARRERAREDREQRRLAGAVRADERDRLAGKELEVGGSERFHLAEPARDPQRAHERGRHVVEVAGGVSGGTTSTSTATGAW